MKPSRITGPISSDLDLHEWQIITEDCLKRCTKCKRYAWWFKCRDEWRWDIPYGTFYYIESDPLAYGFNLKGKFKWVSQSEYSAWGTHVPYYRMHSQPVLTPFVLQKEKPEAKEVSNAV